MPCCEGPGCRLCSCNSTCLCHYRARGASVLVIGVSAIVVVESCHVHVATTHSPKWLDVVMLVVPCGGVFQPLCCLSSDARRTIPQRLSRRVCCPAQQTRAVMCAAQRDRGQHDQLGLRQHGDQAGTEFYNCSGFVSWPATQWVNMRTGWASMGGLPAALVAPGDPDPETSWCPFRAVPQDWTSGMAIEYVASLETSDCGRTVAKDPDGFAELVSGCPRSEGMPEGFRTTSLAPSGVSPAGWGSTAPRAGSWSDHWWVGPMEEAEKVQAKPWGICLDGTRRELLIVAAYWFPLRNGHALGWVRALDGPGA